MQTTLGFSLLLSWTKRRYLCPEKSSTMVWCFNFFFFQDRIYLYIPYIAFSLLLNQFWIWSFCHLSSTLSIHKYLLSTYSVTLGVCVKLGFQEEYSYLLRVEKKYYLNHYHQSSSLGYASICVVNNFPSHFFVCVERECKVHYPSKVHRNKQTDDLHCLRN